LLFFTKHRGTLASPLAITTGHVIGTLGWYGQGGSVIGQVYAGAVLQAIAQETFTTTTSAADLIVSTTPTTTIVPVERMRFRSTGVINIGDETASVNKLWVGGSAFPALVDFSVGKNGAAYGGWSTASNTPATAPILFFTKSKGTMASPSAVQDGDVLGTLGFYGQYSNTIGNVQQGASIQGIARGTFSASNGPADLLFFTVPASSVTPTERVRILSSGNVGINVSAPTARLHVISTTEQLRLGYDASNYISATVGSANAVTLANAVAADITVTAGANKTVVLGNAVYKDINIAGALLSKPASSAPGTDTFRTSAAADTGIETYAFAVGEKVHGGFELQHDYKEGTDLTFHVHYQIIAAPTGTDNVQWRLTYIVQRDGVTLTTVTTIDSPDCAVDTRYRAYRCDFNAITGTNFKIGDQFMFTLERVAADGDAFAGEALIETAGIHHQVDTLGSRTIGAK